MRHKIFFFLSLGFLLFSLVPTVYEVYYRDRLKPERAFELVHNFPTDYNFYLSRIREGIEGHGTVVEKYTSEPHNGSFIHVMYVGLGWIGRFVHVPWERGGDVYHMARIIFGMALLLAIAEYAKRTFAENTNINNLQYVRGRLNRILAGPLTWQLVAFLLAVTASTWPKLVFYNGGWRFGGYMPWWSVMDSLQRITFIPHLLVGQVLLIFLILGLSDEETMRRPGNWIGLGFFAFLLGIILPPALIFVYAIVGILIFFDFLTLVISSKKPITIWFMQSALPRGIVMLLGLPALLYLNLLTTFYPWKRLTEFDILHPLPFDYIEYIKAVGPILPLGLIGLFVSLWKKERHMRASVAWVMAWAALLGIFHFIPQQSPLRFSEMIPHVPLAILSAYFFFAAYQWAVSHRLKSLLSQSLLYVSFLVPTIFITIGIGVMYSSWLWERDFVDHKMVASLPLVPTGSYVMYPLKDFLSAMKFIQDATSRDTVILSETTAGNYLPVYSGNTVYVGHANTVNAEEKEALVKLFFGGRMTEPNARAWLVKDRLSYVFFGPQEKEDGNIADLVKAYPFLRPVYKNTFVTVYQVSL